MKPKATCQSCGADLEWGIRKCPSCGTAIEWPGTEKPARETGSEKKSSGSAVPVRNIAIVVGVIAVGVVLLELISGSGNPPQSAPQQMQSGTSVTETGADMSALPHIEELESQLKADPNNQTLRKELGNHLMDARFFHRAIGVYKEFLNRDPKDPDIRVDLGICYKELGDLDMAAQEMTKALEYSPKHLHAHFNLGIVKLLQGDLPGATEWFKKTVAIDPNGQLGQRAKQLIDQHLSVNIQ